MNLRKPQRGEIWFFDPDPVVGKEQGKKRPCLVLSSNIFNEGKSGLIIIAPCTTKKKSIISHIPISPIASGLISLSFVMPEQIRSISPDRLSGYKIGDVDNNVLSLVEHNLKRILNFS